MPLPFRPRSLLALSLAVPAVVAAPLGAQTADSARTFVVTLGTDTVLTERQTRTPALLRVEMRDANSGATSVVNATLDANAFVRRYDVVTTARGDSVSRRFSVEFFKDSAAMAMEGRSVRGPVGRGAMPFINPSPSFMEQLVLRLRATGLDSLAVPLFIAGVPPLSATVVRLGRDSALVTVGPATLRLGFDADGRLAGGSVPAQNVRITRLAPGAVLAAPSGPDYSAPGGAPYSAEDVIVPVADGARLAGTLTKPRAAAGRVPVIVTLTGSGPQDRDEAMRGLRDYRPFRQLADTLARRGIATLRLDDRGVGGSGPVVGTFTSADYATDIRQVVAWLRARPDIDPARVVLVGHSEGGMVAPMVAADDPAIAAVVLLAGPAYSGRRVLTFQLDQLVRRTDSSATPAQIRARVQQQLDTLAKQPWMRFFIDHDPVPVARRVRMPALIVQAELDRQVTPEQADTLAAAMRAGGNTRVTVRRVPGLNHLFLRDERGTTDYASLADKRVPAEMLGMIADWLVRTLRAAR